MQLGFLGLGKMGSRLTQKLLLDGHEMIVWNRSSAPIEQLKDQISKIKVKIASSSLLAMTGQEAIEDLVKSLNKPRIIWSMLPAGEATENVLQEVSQFVQTGDIIIDGGNANFHDTQRRFDQFQKKGIRFLGIGVSGGVHISETGAALMAGGDKSAFDYVSPILKSISQPRAAYFYLGSGGAGHFAKMVHNAIEYAMMQGIGEGMGIIEKSQYNFELLEVAKSWRRGAIISGFLIDRLIDGLSKDPNLSQITGVIGSKGEAGWAIEEADKEQVPIKIIKDALEFRLQSQTDPQIQNSLAAKVVATLRHEFGGHEIEKKD